MALQEGVPIKCVYGYINKVFTDTKNESDFYLVQVVRESGIQVISSTLPIMPLEQTPEELAALYGPPDNLVGRRVRVDYTGIDFESGVVRIIAEKIPDGGVEMSNAKTRSFQYAMAGGGTI